MKYQFSLWLIAVPVLILVSFGPSSDQVRSSKQMGSQFKVRTHGRPVYHFSSRTVPLSQVIIPENHPEVVEQLPEQVTWIEEGDPKRKEEELLPCEDELIAAYRKYNQKCQKKQMQVSQDEFASIWKNKHSDCYAAYGKYMPRIEIDLEYLPSDAKWKIDGYYAEKVYVTKFMGGDDAVRVSGGDLVLEDKPGKEYFPDPSGEGKIISTNDILLLRLGSKHYAKTAAGEVPNRKKFGLRIGIEAHRLQTETKEVFWTEWFFVEI